MNSRNLISMLTSLLVVGAFAPASPAADFCVGTSSELQAALDAAEFNGEDDTIRLLRGTYVVPPGGFDYFSTEPYGLTIEGDYTEFMNDCMRWVAPTPWDTVLTGGDLYPVMKIATLTTTYHTIRVESLTILNGLFTGPGSDAAGLTIKGYGYDGTKSHIEVENCRFIGNEGLGRTGALTASSHGTLKIVNNLFYGNQGGNYATAFLINDGIGAPSPCIEIINNTVTGNISSTGDGGISIAGSCPSCFIDNNILWGNQRDDLILTTSQGLACRLFNNDLQDYSGFPLSMTGTLNVDPGYVGYLNYRLAPGSPLVDAGIERLNSPIPDGDMDGLPRVAGRKIDIGAFERQTLFDDGFENGSTSYWSATVQ